MKKCTKTVGKFMYTEQTIRYLRYKIIQNQSGATETGI